ncbi:PDR/VanB family oxidoreductase [Rhodococcus koreensis]|uniref:PDR/VanB family oxidoreductase n=1 Tax=Rhodococcus koreensis TaxID=99653 RepID=UPI00197D9C60|nr:PDR/VanB family oxidoreductase [Rhodococcus koreensis]QSE80867.1 oxidoreductase [Rhodococcus koreensis]
MTSDAEFSLQVTAVASPASGVRQVRLERHDRTVLPEWEPGAHIDVMLPNGVVRQYSLCGDPQDPSVYEIAVLRAPQSRGGSEYVHTRLRVGDVIPVRGPRNNFAFAARRRALFIAGGIGITPILAMIRRAEREGIDWTLVYGGRSRDTMAFASELERYGDRVQLVPEDEFGLVNLPGLLGTPLPDTEVYCCGPTGLLDAVQALCKPWPAGSLHLERFSGTVTDGPNDAFTVVAERSGVACSVVPGQSIVEALADAGIIVPTSCGEGLCGTCETKVLDGVPDHRDLLLGDDEREAGTSMMICVSRAKGERLVLDL